MRAKNFCFASVMCLYNNPLTCINRSASCCGALPLDNHFEIHLQNGSILCIWSRASCLSAVKGFSVISCVVSTVVMSDVAGFVMDGVFESLVSLVVWDCCDVWLQVLNAGLSELVAVGIMTVASVLFDNLTSLVWRDNWQLCFLLLISIWMWYCRLQVSIHICWLCYLHSFHWGIWLMVCGHCRLIMLDPWR